MFLCALCALFAASAQAQPLGNAPVDSPYIADAWTPEDGLPQNSILAMAETRDGYLWFGTFNGLVRFDGLRFTVFNPVNTPALRSARILTLNLDSAGWLWIVGEDGSVTRMLDGKFEEMNGRWGLPAGAIVSRGMDPSGNVWLGDSDRVNWIQSGERFLPSVQMLVTAENFTQVGASARTAWLPMSNGWANAQGESLFKQVSEKFDGDPEAKILLVPARDGDTWVILRDQAAKIRSGLVRKFPKGVTVEDPTDAAEDREGNLVIASWNKGAMALSPDGRAEKLPLRGGHSALAVRTLLIDREENIWIGTDLAGLQRLKKRIFRTFVNADQPNGDVTRSIAFDQKNRLWRATGDGVDVMAEDGDFRKLNLPSIPNPSAWWCVTADRDGLIWMGAVSGGLVHIENETVSALSPLDGVRTLARREAGGVWVGTEHGIWSATRDSLVRVETPAALTNRHVRAILETKGNLWIGATGGGLWRKSGNEWKGFGKAEGLADLQVISLHSDAEGTIWVGTVFGGLHRFKNGEFKDFKAAGSRMPTTALCIEEDALGYLWIGSLNGIYRVARQQLNEVADGLRGDLIVQLYDRTDGLGAAEMSEGRQPTVAKGPDGRLWFATINGLSVVDPKMVPANPFPPSVIIENISVNGTPVAVKAGNFTVPPLSQRVEFGYTGISLKAGQRVRFKRRLSGLEDDWVDVGNQRVATYYNLAPGTYRFDVMAANENGVWNAEPVSIALRAAPAWWQSMWFRVGAGMAVGGVLALAMNYRLRRAERAQAAREAFSQQLIELQEKERRRISLELHDGLGQTLLIVKHQASRAAKAADNSPEVVANLQRISQSTQSAIDEVRGIVSALRPAMLDSIGLSGALSAMLEQVSQSGAVKLKWNVADMEGAIPPGREIELFRVVQEALNNVLKHSNAANARVDLRREPSRWILEIEDDGRGFIENDPARRQTSGGFGLKGIRERIRILRGALTIQSRPGEGSLLRAEAPIRPNNER